MEKKGLIVLIIIGFLYWIFKAPSFTDEGTGVILKYHIKQTAGASSGATLPMIIALHGNGDTYDNFYKYTLQDLSTPARVVLIEAPNKYWPYDLINLEKYSTAIAALSQKLQQKHSTSSKPMLLGYSGGGVMAYFTALTNCDKFSSIFPVSGMLKEHMIPDEITTDNSCKVVGFHGQGDSVVAFSGGQFAINELKKHSNKVKLNSFEGGHQGIFRDYKARLFAKITANL